MKIGIQNIILIVFIELLFSNSAFAQKKSSEIINFDDGWRFYLGGMQGAEAPLLNDSQWRKVDLPHDWSIEDRPGTKSPFNPTAINQVSEGFTIQGTGWYRKTFELPVYDQDKQALLQFDGVYMNADVYVNGHHLGSHPYGFTSFYYNITQQLMPGKKNVIAVEVKNEGQNSRWYSGSGIYRHVWLKMLSPVHVTQWGTYITTPQVSESSAQVNIASRLENNGNENAIVNVITKLISPNGNEAARTESKVRLKSGEKQEIKTNTVITNPDLWSCESPATYKAITEIYNNGNLINSEENTFGIRRISF